VLVKIYGMCGVEGNCMQGCGGENLGKESICETLAFMGRWYRNGSLGNRIGGHWSGLIWLRIEIICRFL